LKSVTFKNVGQGDSIVIEWICEGENRIGIIDCNLHGEQNPVVEYLSTKSITTLDFVILSHFHYDHFSGMPGLFKYCIENEIKIKFFLHTIAEHVLQIYDKILTSKKIEAATVDFFNYLEELGKTLDDDISVNIHTAPFKFSDSLLLSFLGPSEKTGSNIAKQINRKVNTKDFTYSDINKFSTISYFQFADSGVLFTADSVKVNYRNLNKFIDKEIILVQVPHHGSFANIYPPFWTDLKKKKDCPAVFSVGYEPKDKLPNVETVEFIDKAGFEVHSTNPYFGISEYFNGHEFTMDEPSRNKSNYLNHFSKKIRTRSTHAASSSKYEGDQTFKF